MTKLGWISFLVLLAEDIILRRRYHAITEITVVSFAIACTFSVFFWSLIDLTVRTFLNKYCNVVAALIALFWVILLTTQAIAFTRFGEYVTPFMLNWIISDPKYILDYLWPLLNAVNVLAFTLAWVLFYWLWKPKREKTLRANRKQYVKWILALALSAIALNQLRRETLGQLKLADGAFAFSLDSILKKGNSTGYRFSRRQNLSAAKSSSPLPHVFLFIGESWSKNMIPVYGWNQTDTMPFLKSFNQIEKVDRYLSAYTNSGATDVSIPSLFSGVGPEESSDKLHRVPLIWDWARAAGYQTVFISPQRLAFNGIHQFFLSPGPDLFIPGDAIDFKMVNDSGVDDLKAVDFLANKLYELKLNNKPLFIIFFHNALHFPFLTESPGIEVPNFDSRYEKALFITDSVIKRIVTVLKEQKLWEQTLFWMTADHGEVETPTNKVPRISSFYQEILGIPFMIRWPQSKEFKTLNDKCDLEGKQNFTKNVQNLDIVPTLIDIWSLRSVNQVYAEQLKGSSLCRSVPDERFIIHLNTNSVRQWSPEGFAVTRGKHRFSFTNLEGPKFFDLTVTSETTQEKEISNGSRADTEPFLKIIESENLLKDLWLRYPEKHP